MGVFGFSSTWTWGDPPSMLKLYDHFGCSGSKGGKLELERVEGDDKRLSFLLFFEFELRGGCDDFSSSSLSSLSLSMSSSPSLSLSSKEIEGEEMVGELRGDIFLLFFPLLDLFGLGEGLGKKGDESISSESSLF